VPCTVENTRAGGEQPQLSQTSAWARDSDQIASVACLPWHTGHDSIGVGCGMPWLCKKSYAQTGGLLSVQRRLHGRYRRTQCSLVVGTAHCP